MRKKITVKYVVYFLGLIWLNACKVPALVSKQENKSTPSFYKDGVDTNNVAKVNWKV